MESPHGTTGTLGTAGTTSHAPPSTAPIAIARRKSAVQRSVLDEYAQVRAEREEMERTKFQKAIASTTSKSSARGSHAQGGGGAMPPNAAAAAASGGRGRNSNSNSAPLRTGRYAKGTLQDAAGADDNDQGGPSSSQKNGSASSRHDASYRSALSSGASSYQSAVGSVASGMMASTAAAGGGQSHASSSSGHPDSSSSLDRSMRSLHSIGNLSACLFDPEHEHYLDPDLMEQRAAHKERQRLQQEEEQKRWMRDRLERQRMGRQQHKTQKARGRGGGSAFGGGSDSGRNSLYSVRTKSSDGHLSTDGSNGGTQQYHVFDDDNAHNGNGIDDDARSVGTISIDLDAIAQEMKDIYARPHPDDVQAQTKARVQRTLRTARDELLHAKDELLHLGEHVVDGVRKRRRSTFRSDGTLGGTGGSADGTLSAAAAAALVAEEDDDAKSHDDGDATALDRSHSHSHSHSHRVRSAVRHAREELLHAKDELVHLGERAADGVRRGSDFFTGSSEDSWGEEEGGGGGDENGGSNNKSTKKRARPLRSVVEAVAKQMPHVSSAANGVGTARPPKKGILKRPSFGTLSEADMVAEEAASRLAAGSGDLPLPPPAAYKYEEEIISLAEEGDDRRDSSRRRSIDSGAYLAGVQDFLRPTKDEPSRDERMARTRQSGDSDVSHLTSSLGGSSNSSKGKRDVFEDEDDDHDEEQGHGDKMESIGLVGGSNERAKLLNSFRSRRILLGVAVFLFLVTVIAVALRPASDNAIGFHLRPEFFDIPMPPSNLDDICQQPEYREECEIVCNQASCCYRNGRSSCRNSAHESICALYSPCDVLYNLDGGEDMLYNPSASGVASAFGIGSQKVVSKPPPFLSDICSLKGNGEVKDHDSCLEICSEASCCLERGPNLSCRNNAMNSGRCSLYQRYCSNLPQSELVSDFDGIIPSPPLGLGELCDRQHISTDKEAAEECERLCSVGLCCVGLGLDSNCALSDEADCMGYKRHCAAVWPDEAYDNVPSLLPVEFVSTPFKSVCSVADQGSLADICDELCNDVASCCWDTGPGNCLEYNRATCNDYSNCDGYISAAGGKIRHSDPILPNGDLEMLCTAPHVLHPDGVKDCKEACTHGGCCLLEESNEAYCGDRPVCSHYEVCSNLPYDEWARQDVPSPIEYICSNERLDSPGGREACSEACESGRCCWDETESYSCFADDPSACYEYDACRANAFVPSAPSNLPKVCADPNNPASKALCLQMCQPAACCFEGKMTTGTGVCEVANLYTCSEYDGPCDIVLDMMDYGLGQRSAVTPVVQACSEKSLQTDEGIQSCRKQCSDAWCCVVDDPSLSCFESNPLFCAAYAPVCGPLLSSDVLYSDIKDKSKATANPIELTCSVKNILTAEGRAQCEAECSYAACCKENGRWSCQDKNEEYCEQMKACDVLERVDRAKVANVGIAVPHAAGNINDLCSKQAILSFSGRSDCDKACVPGLCCFDADQSTSCRSTNMEACKSYDSCSIMFEDRLGL